MKTLLIIRHAKSDHDHHDLKDIDRPLAPRGERDVALMGDWLFSKKLKPDLMISSPAVRARATADIFCKSLHIKPGNVVIENVLYSGQISEMIKMLQSSGKKSDTVFIFGHNPSFSILANSLCPDFEEDMPTTGIVALQFIADEWKEIREGEGHLLWFEFPKKYRNK